MIVRDEEEQLLDCLTPIFQLFDEIAIVDTGSRDRTREILADRFGIVALEYPRDSTSAFNFGAARNFAQTHLHADWILRLDADERIEPDAIQQFKGISDNPDVCGYFGRWVTSVGDDVIEDYKLFLHRRDVRCLGAIHENHQIDIRDRGQHAVWLDGLEVVHRRRVDNIERRKQSQRLVHLRECIRSDRHWYRYHWFAGLTLMRLGDVGAALPYLESAANSESVRFPVECLNSYMGLCEIYSTLGTPGDIDRTLNRGFRFLETVADDFEVKVNFRLESWFKAAAELLSQGRESEIKAYGFSF